MRHYEKSNYVVTARGDIDVNFYISRARRLRNQAIKTHAVELVEKIKRTANSAGNLSTNPKAA